MAASDDESVLLPQRDGTATSPPPTNGGHEAGPGLLTWLRRPESWLVPLATTLVLYIIWFAVARRLGAVLPGKALALDFLIQAAVGVSLWFSVRSVMALVAFQLLAQFALPTAHLVKIWAFGAPLLATDGASLIALFWVLWKLAPAQLVTVLGLVGLLTVVALRGLDWRKVWLPAAALLVPWALVFAAPHRIDRALDGVFGPVREYYKVSTFKRRAPTLYMVGEVARARADQWRAPTSDEVEAAASQLLQGAERPGFSAPFASAHQRNVLVVNVESLWHPWSLTHLFTETQVVAPGFLEHWRRGGFGFSLSSVYGGLTAESEFELLCGVPGRLWQGLEFLRLNRGKPPCLPRQLSSAGYRTVAIHPNMRSFWNRDNAYPTIGFDAYWSERDLAERWGRTPESDAELFATVAERLPELLAEGPTFLYVLSLGLHSPYPRDRSVAPDIWRPPSAEVDRLVRYTNSFHYTAEAVIDLVASAFRVDPDMLVVVVGDHRPVLGNVSLTDGQLAATQEQDDVQQVLRRASTPLLLFDAGRPIDIGRLLGRRPLLTPDPSWLGPVVPQYHLPALISQLLGSSVGPLDLVQSPPDSLLLWQERPVVWAGEAVVRCSPTAAEAACVTATRWGNAARTVADDLLFGRGHTLRQ